MNIYERLEKVIAWRVYVRIDTKETIAMYDNEMAKIIGLAKSNFIRRVRRLGLERKKLHRSRTKK